MKKTDVWKAYQVSHLKRRVIVGAGLALLVIIGSAAFAWPFIRMSPPIQTSPMTIYSPSHHGQPPVGKQESYQHKQSTVATQATTTSNPWGIALDIINGYVWVAEPGCEALPTCPSTFPGIIGEYALSDGSLIQDYREPPEYSSPLFVASDADDNIWFTQPNSDAIGELNPQNGTWNQWTVKKGSVPYDLTFDKHGNIWFTESRANKIGFFNPQTQKLVENPIPTPGSDPYGITMDPKGNIWFTENRAGVGQIGSFTPTLSGTVTIVEHGVGYVQPHLITSDKAGNIWYSEAFTGSIGKFDPASGTSRHFSVSTGICPIPATCHGTHISGISVDKRGYVWFDDSLSGRVGYLVPTTEQVVVRTLPKSDAHPHDGLATDSNNNVWFTEQNAFLLVMWPPNTVK